MHPTIIFGIDPGIDITGYSILELTDRNVSVKAINSIKVNVSTTDIRVRSIVPELYNIIINNSKPEFKNVVAIECPNDCLYGRSAGRSGSILKLFSAVYGIFGGLIIQGIPCFIVRPKEWQVSKKDRNNQEVKEWSRERANSLLRKFNINRKPFIKAEQDIADSLNIAVHGMGKILNGEWLL